MKSEPPTPAIPPAPRPPLPVCFLLADYNNPIHGFYGDTVTSGNMIALLPYVDIPNGLTINGGIAFIESNGNVGITSSTSILEKTSSVDYESREAKRFMGMFEDSNWGIVPMLFHQIDWDKHSAERTDDGSFDPIPESLFGGIEDILVCSWCGHPNDKSDSHNTSNYHCCESCNAEIHQDGDVLFIDTIKAGEMVDVEISDDMPDGWEGEWT
mgnify:CR=1 FL=1|jgi:hypothetical protein